MFGWFKKMSEQLEKENPLRVTLTGFDIEFTTLDGAKHIFSRVNYMDENTLIDRDGLHYYICDKKFLKDDDGVIYPMENIISIRKVNVQLLTNVKAKHIPGTCYNKTYYPEEDIEFID